MTAITVFPTDWTQIVAPGGAEDVTIRSGDGQFYVSLEKPAEAELRIIAKPPVSVQSGLWTRFDVQAGIAVFAKAVVSPAIAEVKPAAK